MKHYILSKMHASPIGGHMGFLKTYHKVEQDFFWEGLKGDVQKFVLECLVYQQQNAEAVKSPRQLWPLAIPSLSWERVSMDFITDLPKSEG